MTKRKRRADAEDVEVAQGVEPAVSRVGTRERLDHVAAEYNIHHNDIAKELTRNLTPLAREAVLRVRPQRTRVFPSEATGVMR